MNLNLKLITDLYKKTSFFLFILSVLSFFVVYFLSNLFKAYSFSIGCFILFLNVLGFFLIAKYSKEKSNINKERIVFSIILFIGKLFVILAIIFALIKYNLVNNLMFLAGLSLGFGIFFIVNLIFLLLKIHRQEQASNESY